MEWPGNGFAFEVPGAARLLVAQEKGIDRVAGERFLECEGLTVNHPVKGYCVLLLVVIDDENGIARDYVVDDGFCPHAGKGIGFGCFPKTNAQCEGFGREDLRGWIVEQTGEGGEKRRGIRVPIVAIGIALVSAGCVNTCIGTDNSGIGIELFPVAPGGFDYGQEL